MYAIVRFQQEITKFFVFSQKLFNYKTTLKTNNFVAKFKQGIIDSTGTETRQIFSRTFAMATSFEELFAPT